MAYTLLQLQQMGATPITPTQPTTQTGGTYTADQLQQMGAQPVKPTGFLGTLKGIYDNVITKPITAAEGAIETGLSDTSNALGDIIAPAFGAKPQTTSELAGSALDATGSGVGTALNIVGSPLNAITSAISNIPAGGGKNIGDRVQG